MRKLWFRFRHWLCSHPCPLCGGSGMTIWADIDYNLWIELCALCDGEGQIE